MKQIIVAITGASGAPYAQRLLQRLSDSAVRLHVVVSPTGRRVLADELGLRTVTIDTLLGRPGSNAALYAHDDLGAKIASGSSLTNGMVVCPCSSHTLAAVAGGLADNLITRAAMVTLKERRKLIIAHRESPLTHIDIENMQRCARAGAIICPLSPGFYLGPTSIDELIDFMAGKILDLLNVPHDLDTRWEAHSAQGRRADDPA